jgi:hypothetical protein
MGYTLLDVFKREYRGRTEDYYVRDIAMVTVKMCLSIYK